MQGVCACGPDYPQHKHAALAMQVATLHCEAPCTMPDLRTSCRPSEVLRKDECDMMLCESSGGLQFKFSIKF